MKDRKKEERKRVEREGGREERDKEENPGMKAGRWERWKEKEEENGERKKEILE